jgi:hypothetical protein
MIKPQHDSQRKRLPDLGEKRGSRMRSIRMGTRKVMKIQDMIYGKEHDLDRVRATRHQTAHFFDTTSAQGDLGWSSGQAMGFYKLCRCDFKGKTHKGQKTPTQACDLFFKGFHLLNSRLFGGGSFHEQNKQQIFFLVLGRRVK